MVKVENLHKNKQLTSKKNPACDRIGGRPYERNIELGGGGDEGDGDVR